MVYCKHNLAKHYIVVLEDEACPRIVISAGYW
ncbi:MAG: hypothetical protein KatS3mg110_1783 [Pirellulaceae bacterium]|nr:MAG: hypothetical protein KatS3mg110_1783 [Pirellulaceae bacterium]